MSNKEDIRKEIEQISPYLGKVPRSVRKPDVPDGYFQRFEDSFIRDVVRPGLQGSTATESKTGLMGRVEGWLASLFQPKYALALASMAILIAAALWLVGPQNVESYSVDFASLSEEEVDVFIEENLDDLLLAELNLENVQGGEDDLFENLDPADIESYSDELLEEIELIELENIF